MANMNPHKHLIYPQFQYFTLLSVVLSSLQKVFHWNNLNHTHLDDNLKNLLLSNNTSALDLLQISYMALLARLWNNFRELTSLGGLVGKVVTQTLFDLSLAAAASSGVLSPRRRWISLISKKSTLQNAMNKSQMIRHVFHLEFSIVLNVTEEKRNWKWREEDARYKLVKNQVEVLFNTVLILREISPPPPTSPLCEPSQLVHVMLKSCHPR